MIRRQASAAEAVEEDRDPEQLGQGAEPILSPSPVETGPGHDRRPLGPRQQRCRLLDTGRRGPACRRKGGNLGLRLAENDVERVVEEGRAARRRGGEIERRGCHRRDPGRVLDRLRVLDQRRDEGEVIDLLQRAGAPAHLRRPPAEDADRRPVRLGAGDRAHPVGHSGARGERRDPDVPGRLREALGGERCGLLVADVDDLDPLRPAAVVDREKVPARQREEMADPARLQRLGNNSPPVLHGSKPMGCRLASVTIWFSASGADTADCRRQRTRSGAGGGIMVLPGWRNWQKRRP